MEFYRCSDVVTNPVDSFDGYFKSIDDRPGLGKFECVEENIRTLGSIRVIRGEDREEHGHKTSFLEVSPELGRNFLSAGRAGELKGSRFLRQLNMSIRNNRKQVLVQLKTIIDQLEKRVML